MCYSQAQPEKKITLAFPAVCSLPHEGGAGAPRERGGFQSFKFKRPFRRPVKPNLYTAGSELLCALDLERDVSALPPQQVQGLAHSTLASRHASRAHPCTARTQPARGGAAPAALAAQWQRLRQPGPVPAEPLASTAGALRPCANGPPRAAGPGARLAAAQRGQDDFSSGRRQLPSRCCAAPCGRAARAPLRSVTPAGVRHPRAAHGSCSTSAFPQSTPGAPAVLCSPQGKTKHHGQSWKHPQGARVPAKGLREGQSGQERQFCSRRSETLYAQHLPLFGSAGIAAAASPGAAPPAQHLLPAPPKSAGSRAMRPRGAAPRGPRSDPQLGQRHRFCVCASRGNGEARNRLKTIAQLRSSSFQALWIILVSQPCRLSVGAPSHPLGAGCPPALFEELSGAAPPTPKAPLPPQQRGGAKL